MPRQYAPKDFGSSGAAAWRAAERTLGALGLDPKLVRESMRRYAHAVDRLAAVEAEWQRLGRPAISHGSSDQPVAHPLLKELREETRAVEELEQALVKDHPRERALRGTRKRGGKLVPLKLPDEVENALGS